MAAYFVPFLIYWFILFVLCYVIVEVGQDQFYDAVTPNAPLKVAAGAAILAGLAAYFRPSFDTMFTAQLQWTIVQAMVWLPVFIFVFQFHPRHALAISTLALVFLTGAGTLVVQNLTTPTRTLPAVNARGAPPVRRSLGPAIAPAKDGAAPK